jgi:hypothetical protein
MRTVRQEANLTSEKGGKKKGSRRGKGVQETTRKGNSGHERSLAISSDGGTRPAQLGSGSGKMKVTITVAGCGFPVSALLTRMLARESLCGVVLFPFLWVLFMALASRASFLTEMGEGQ